MQVDKRTVGRALGGPHLAADRGLILGADVPHFVAVIGNQMVTIQIMTPFSDVQEIAVSHWHTLYINIGTDHFHSVHP